MIRLTSIAAAALLGFSSIASAQFLPNSSYRSAPSSDRYSGSTTQSTDRYAPQNQMPGNDRYGTQMPDRYSNSDRYSNGDRSMSGRTSNDRYAPMRHTSRHMGANQFASENEARSSCRGDTVVWMNNRSHVFHIAGSPKFGNTKHGAFMCRGDAENAGRVAKNERAAALR